MTESQPVGGCGCSSEPQAATSAATVPVDPPIACSLGAQDIPQRVSDWQGVVAEATARSASERGVRLAFPPSPELAARIAGLAAAETHCCAFFRMTLTMASTELALDVECPTAARPLLDELLAV